MAHREWDEEIDGKAEAEGNAFLKQKTEQTVRKIGKKIRHQRLMHSRGENKNEMRVLKRHLTK